MPAPEQGEVELGAKSTPSANALPAQLRGHFYNEAIAIVEDELQVDKSSLHA